MDGRRMIRGGGGGWGNLILGLAAAVAGCGGDGNSGTDPGSGSNSTPTSSSTYSVGGTVSGISGPVALQDNGGDSITVSADGSFSFPTALAAGATYSVTVATPPSGQTCTVSQGSGTVGSADVTGVAVSCSAASTTASPDLVALAAVVAAIQVGASLPVMLDVAESQATCASGGVTITPSPFDAQFSGCVSAFDPGDAFSGGLASSFVGVAASTLGGLTIVNTGLLNATITVPTTQVFETASLAAGTLSATVSATSLSFTIGQSSSYQLGTFTIGSPQAMTRTSSGAGVAVSLPAVAGEITLGQHTYVLSQLSPLGWTDSGAPTSGSLQIREGSSLLLQASFQSDGSVQLEDGITGFSGTRAWTDADLAAALRQVTQ